MITFSLPISCETVLLRVYNDIVTTIGRVNSDMLVLFDLYATFDNLFGILEKYVGICGIALKINDTKTQFIVFRSSELRCHLSGLSVNVGENQITQSLKVRDLCVTLTNFSTLMIILLLYVEAHISYWKH